MSITTIESIAATVRDAHRERRTVTPWGAGTHQYLAEAEADDALRIETAGLSQIIDYTPADLTITLEAGVGIGAVQDLLRPNAQWLPWDPPARPEATIGGLLACGLSGPLRLAHGTARDRVLGMKVILGDGRVVKSGGRVVKNVAGYDSHKLHIGAFGTLGIIAEVTFKLAPIPERDEIIAFACPNPAVALDLADALRQTPLSPVSLLAQVGVGACVLSARFSTVAAAVARQLDVARGRAAQLGAAECAPRAPEPAAFSLPGSGETDLIARVGVPPAQLRAAVALLAALRPTPELLIYPGVGLIQLRRAATPEDPIWLADLRARLLALGGYAVAEHVPVTSGALDRWGPPPETVALMRRLKARWNPHDTLNRGRYIVT